MPAVGQIEHTEEVRDRRNRPDVRKHGDDEAPLARQDARVVEIDAFLHRFEANEEAYLAEHPSSRNALTMVLGTLRHFLLGARWCPCDGEGSSRWPSTSTLAPGRCRAPLVDVDLEHGSIHIHRSVDRVRKRKTGSTKSDRARRIPIEPELVPLLRALLAGSDATGVMFAMPSVGVLSHKLKVYLRRAGVTREDLFVTDETRKAITFHDLRATGITWAIVRGDETTKVQQRAWHDEYETTQIYLREAENLSEGFGEVFPPLPEDLMGSGSIGSVSDSASLAEAIEAESLDVSVALTGIALPCTPPKRSGRQSAEPAKYTG